MLDQPEYRNQLSKMTDAKLEEEIQFLISCKDRLENESLEKKSPQATIIWGSRDVMARLSIANYEQKNRTLLMPSQYILMKASRNPSKEVAQVSDAYGGSAGKIYTNLAAASSDALSLKAGNPVGFRVWRIGESFPTASTETNDHYKGQAIPELGRE